MTDEQRLFFETNGYLVLPDALTPDELEAARTAAARAEARWQADPSLPGMRRPNLRQVQAPIEYDPLFLDLMEHPRVFPLVRAILGDDISMIDNDLFLSPPCTATHAHWHHDVGLAGVFHPRSVLMVKAFYLLSDVGEDGGATLILPGSHRYPMDFDLPRPATPGEMPNHARLAHPAGTAYLFNGRCYHAASNNESSRERRVLIFNYGHFWMKVWPGYEPSERLRAAAATPLRRQLLGIGDAYGPYPLQEPGD